jgi:hypothetical protein
VSEYKRQCSSFTTLVLQSGPYWLALPCPQSTHTPPGPEDTEFLFDAFLDVVVKFLAGKSKKGAKLPDVAGVLLLDP